MAARREQYFRPVWDWWTPTLQGGPRSLRGAARAARLLRHVSRGALSFTTVEAVECWKRATALGWTCRKFWDAVDDWFSQPGREHLRHARDVAQETLQACAPGFREQVVAHAVGKDLRRIQADLRDGSYGAPVPEVDARPADCTRPDLCDAAGGCVGTPTCRRTYRVEVQADNGAVLAAGAVTGPFDLSDLKLVDLPVPQVRLQANLSQEAVEALRACASERRPVLLAVHDEVVPQRETVHACGVCGGAHSNRLDACPSQHVIPLQLPVEEERLARARAEKAVRMQQDLDQARDDLTDCATQGRVLRDALAALVPFAETGIISIPSQAAILAAKDALAGDAWPQVQDWKRRALDAERELEVAVSARHKAERAAQALRDEVASTAQRVGDLQALCDKRGRERDALKAERTPGTMYVDLAVELEATKAALAESEAEVLQLKDELESAYALRDSAVRQFQEASDQAEVRRKIIVCRDDEILQLKEERDKLVARREQLLQTVAKVSRETPYPEELRSWEEQRGKLVAAVGGYRACLREVLRLVNDAMRPHGLHGVPGAVRELLSLARQDAERCLLQPQDFPAYLEALRQESYARVTASLAARDRETAAAREEYIRLSAPVQQEDDPIKCVDLERPGLTWTRREHDWARSWHAWAGTFELTAVPAGEGTWRGAFGVLQCPGATSLQDAMDRAAALAEEKLSQGLAAVRKAE